MQLQWAPHWLTRKLWWLATYTAGSSAAGRFSLPSICREAAARHACLIHEAGNIKPASRRYDKG